MLGRPLELWLDARGASADDAIDWEAFQESADAVLVREGNATGSLGSAAKRQDRREAPLFWCCTGTTSSILLYVPHRYEYAVHMSQG